MIPRWYPAVGHVRGRATAVGMVAVLVGIGGGLVLGDRLPDAVVLVLSLGGFVLLAVGTLLHFMAPVPRMEPRELLPPVRGRWTALNSPAGRVPSHGTHGHGQTFAIDLVFDPENSDPENSDPENSGRGNGGRGNGGRPEFGQGKGFRPPEDFPGFGRPLFAPASGTIVAVRDTARDHLSRSSWPAFVYLMLEGVVRELGGSRFAIGNHVVVEADGGGHVLLAHLRRGSAAVRVGQRVDAGQRVGECGNSGNTSEPHVHVQLMTGPRPFVASGLPFRFDEPRLPANGEATEF